MRTIYKYNLWYGSNLISMPEGSKVLHVGDQDNTIRIWIEHEIESSNLEVERNFHVYETGAMRDDFGNHIGTVQLYDSGVWHVYEK